VITEAERGHAGNITSNARAETVQISRRSTRNFFWPSLRLRTAVREAADRFPSFLAELRNRVAKFAGRRVDEFRQVGVNEYSPGAGIGWHKEKAQFGVIVGVSLLAPATMRFRRSDGDRWVRMSQRLLPRSIYILEAEARTMWEHSIPPSDALRYSLHFSDSRTGLKASILSLIESRLPQARSGTQKRIFHEQVTGVKVCSSLFPS
jgi:alkylated DNA repair dioxygenase AlkB